MADPPVAQKPSSFGFLTRKIGPVPIWLIGVAGFGAYWWWKHRHHGSAAAPARGAGPGRTNITIRETEGGKRGKAPHGAPPAGAPAVPPVARRNGYAPPARGQEPGLVPPAEVAAPMTSADVYGDMPVASPDGSTYDSGDVASTMGAAYAVAG